MSFCQVFIFAFEVDYCVSKFLFEMTLDARSDDFCFSDVNAVIACFGVNAC